MHFLLAGKVLLSLETQTEMSMEYDSTECVSRCAARAGAEPQRQRKPGNPANHVAFKAGNKLKGNANQATRGKPMLFPVQKQLKGNANRVTQRITLLLKPATN